MLVEIIRSLFTLGFNLLSIIFKLGIALVIGYTMAAKGRNGLFWGIAGFFIPWLILVTIFIPAKVPKLPKAIRHLPAFQGKNPMVASIMALSAMVAKSDGFVTKEEIKMVRTYVQKHFRIGASELNAYEGAFNYGKEHPEDYAYFTELLRHYRRYNIVSITSYLLVGIAMQDGAATGEEESILRRIVTGLGLHEYEYQSIKQYYARGSSQGPGYGQYGGYQGYYQQNSQSGYGHQGVPRENLTEKYSEVLGVPVDADLSVVKKAYRKLAKENHPDKMAQDGMPEEYIQFANERISAINEAYDYLKEVKAAMA